MDHLKNKTLMILVLGIFLLLVSSSLVAASAVRGAEPSVTIATSASEATPITLMTYNVRYGRGFGDEDISITGADYEQNINDIASIILAEQPDIVALQETRYTKSGKTYATVPKLKELLAGKYTLHENGAQALLIKVGHNLITGPRRTNYQAGGGRYYLRSIVVIGGVPYTIYQTHLTRPRFVDQGDPGLLCQGENDDISCCPSQSNDKDHTNTNNQFIEFIKALRVESTSSPVIAMGDLNIDKVRFTELTDFTRGISTTFPTSPYCHDDRFKFGLFEKNEKIDYIFGSPKFNVETSYIVETQEGLLGSDHYPVVAKVKFTGQIPEIPSGEDDLPEDEPEQFFAGSGGDVSPSPVRVSQATTGRSTTPVTASLFASSRIQRIDKAWLQVGPAIRSPNAGRIWDPNRNWWAGFNDVYVPQSVAVPPTAESQTGSQVQYTNYASVGKLDPLFIKYGSRGDIDIDPALLKGLASAESGLNQLAIGPIGEVGLYQFKGSSGATYFGAGVVTCCAPIEHGEKYRCENEHTQAGGRTWKPGIYQCDQETDPRFDVERQIEAGGRLTRSNFDRFNKYPVASTDDQLKLAVAAHHFGGAGIENCIKGKLITKKWPNSKCQQDISGTTISWESLAANLPTTLYKGKKRSYASVMNSYIEDRVWKRYRKYEAQMTQGPLVG
jgi:endonuclease/exonuclease/phosphatase family metal-dependent hydrolase